MQPDRESGRRTAGTAGNFNGGRPAVAAGNRKGSSPPGLNGSLSSWLPAGGTKRSRITARRSYGGLESFSEPGFKTTGNSRFQVTEDSDFGFAIWDFGLNKRVD